KRNSVSAKSYTQDLSVIVILDLLRDLLAAGGVDPSAAAPADVAFVLARAHFRMSLAKRGDLRGKLDGCLLLLTAVSGYADVQRARRHRDGRCRSRGNC